jgi:hypothetical protein
MARYRILATALVFVALLVFMPKDAKSDQTFDATLRFNPTPGTLWHYINYTIMYGDEISFGRRDRVGGLILTVFDEEVDSSGNGLVGMHLRFNVYQAIDLGAIGEFSDPGGPLSPPDYDEPAPGDTPQFDFDLPLMPGTPLQAAGPGGPPGGGGGGGDDLVGEGEFDIVPIMDTTLNYTMSESGRILDIAGMELIGEISDPSRSINVRQLFETMHFVVLPDYEVHLNENWRAPMSWTIPYVGETMEIPLVFTLADIRTTYRFRMAAIDFHGILQFDVDIADEGMMEDDYGNLESYRKESNIKGDIIIQGRLYVDIDRGILIAITDLPAIGSTPFVDGDRRGNEPYPNALGQPWPLNPGFYASLNFERRDLYTPLGNVIDPRQDLVHRIQEMQWLTTMVVE